MNLAEQNLIAGVASIVLFILVFYLVPDIPEVGLDEDDGFCFDKRMKELKKWGK